MHATQRCDQDDCPICVHQPDYKRLLEIAVEALERIESGPEIPISSIGPRTPKEIAIWAAENSQEIAREALEKIRGEMK